MNIIQRRTDELIPYERNQKKHDEKQVRNVANSIKRFGWQQPIVVDSKDVIIIGHCRWEAAKMLGMDTVPVTCADNLTEDEVRELRIADNKTNESPWDFDALEADLDELDFDGFEFEFDGMGAGDDGEETPDVQEDDFDESEQAPSLAQTGDIYQLGRHRLMCGDSTDADNIEKLICGAEIELLFTDPPYGIHRDKGFDGSRGFAGKGKPIKSRKYDDDWDSFTPDKATFDSLISHANKAIIFGGNFFTDKLPQGNHWLVWDKHNTMPTYGDCELAWTNIDRNSVKKYDYTYNGLIGKEKERFHPTQKPVALFASIINDYTEDGKNILDAFGGSGTTMIAAEQTNRAAYLMELDPHYCDVIIKRWEDFTGEKAVLLNG